MYTSRLFRFSFNANVAGSIRPIKSSQQRSWNTKLREKKEKLLLLLPLATVHILYTYTQFRISSLYVPTSNSSYRYGNRTSVVFSIRFHAKMFSFPLHLACLGVIMLIRHCPFIWTTFGFQCHNVVFVRPSFWKCLRIDYVKKTETSVMPETVLINHFHSIRNCRRSMGARLQSAIRRLKSRPSSRLVV